MIGDEARQDIPPPSPKAAMLLFILNRQLLINGEELSHNNPPPDSPVIDRSALLSINRRSHKVMEVQEYKRIPPQTLVRVIVKPEMVVFVSAQPRIAPALNFRAEEGFSISRMVNPSPVMDTLLTRGNGNFSPVFEGENCPEPI